MSIFRISYTAGGRDNYISVIELVIKPLEGEQLPSVWPLDLITTVEKFIQHQRSLAYQPIILGILELAPEPSPQVFTLQPINQPI